MTDDLDRGPGHPLAGAAGCRLTTDDLVYLNRMTVTGLVLPNVAHEVNNALQVVSGLVEMVAARPDLPAEAAEKLSRIGAQAGRASTMLRDLVEFSRRDNGGVTLVDLRKVVEAALAMRRYHLSRQRVAIDVDALPAGPSLARADGHCLQQALVNLIVNAEQALQGSDKPALRIAIEVEGSEAAISVEDNGPGLPNGQEARVGEAFFTTRRARTLGLGLAVARVLIEQQGGRLEIRSRPGGGVRARMGVPRHVPDA
jgi:signal transduction histidine kinase